MGAFHLGDEFDGALFLHAEVCEVRGFFSIGEGGVHGEEYVGLFVVFEDAADGCDVLLDGFPDFLAFVAGDGVFGAA